MDTVIIKNTTMIIVAGIGWSWCSSPAGNWIFDDNRYNGDSCFETFIMPGNATYEYCPVRKQLEGTAVLVNLTNPLRLSICA